MLRGFPRSHSCTIYKINLPKRPKSGNYPNWDVVTPQVYSMVPIVDGLCKKNPRQASADGGSIKGGNDTSYRVSVLWHLGSSCTHRQMPCHSSGDGATQVAPKRMPWTYLLALALLLQLDLRSAVWIEDSSLSRSQHR